MTRVGVLCLLYGNIVSCGGGEAMQFMPLSRMTEGIDYGYSGSGELKTPAKR